MKPSTMAGHPTVDVMMDGVPIPIDVEIAELVDLVNQAGFRTEVSCQEDEDGRSEIAFVSIADAVGFLNIAASPAGVNLQGLWNRITHVDEPDDFPPFQMWSYYAAADDRSMDWAHDGTSFVPVRSGPPDIASG